MTHLNELHFGDVILGADGYAMVIDHEENITTMGRRRAATRLFVLTGRDSDVQVLVPDDLICKVEDYA